MRRSIRIKNITLIIIMILMVVITVFPSCSADNSSLTLCNVKLDYDNSRSFSELSLDSKLTNSNLRYKAYYLGSGSSYYGAKSEFVPYPEEGLILSQGLWKIDCRWMNGDIIVAEGTTREIWINLNTTSILVYLEENKGKGSFSLGSYKVNCTDHSVTSISYDISLCKYNNGLFDSNIIFADSEIEISADSDIETDTETGCISTLKLKKDDLDSGAYLLTIKVFNGSNKTDANLLFTDVLGFMVKEGHETAVTGSCEVKKGTIGKNEYIYWEDDPSIPTGNKVEVGGGTTTGSTENRKNLNTEVIQDKTTYIVHETTSGSGAMDLDHSNESSGNRILTPTVAAGKTENNFAIDMKGTDVIVSSSEALENTTIIQLNNNITMNLFNSSTDSASWGVSNSSSWLKTRLDSNVKVNGGALNVIGAGDSQSVSNGPIVFVGPSKNDSSTTFFQKQGAINFEGTGGKVILDGDVTVNGLIGVSSIEAGSSNSTLTASPINIELKMVNSKITSEAAKKLWGYQQETSYGIYLTCSNKGGSIEIVLDGATITAKGSGDNIDESGIRIDNFAGDINITLKNKSIISSEVGNGLYFNNCSGIITITMDDTANSITGGTCALNVNNSSPVVVNKNGTKTTYTSSQKNIG